MLRRREKCCAEPCACRTLGLLLSKVPEKTPAVRYEAAESELVSTMLLDQDSPASRSRRALQSAVLLIASCFTLSLVAVLASPSIFKLADFQLRKPLLQALFPQTLAPLADSGGDVPVPAPQTLAPIADSGGDVPVPQTLAPLADSGDDVPAPTTLAPISHSDDDAVAVAPITLAPIEVLYWAVEGAVVGMVVGAVLGVSSGCSTGCRFHNNRGCRSGCSHVYKHVYIHAVRLTEDVARDHHIMHVWTHVYAQVSARMSIRMPVVSTKGFSWYGVLRG